MRNTRVAAAIYCLLFMTVAGEARAHPPWMPPSGVVPPTAAELDALERTGRQYKTSGAILMGVGAAIAVAGTGLLIGGAVRDDDRRCLGHAGDARFRADRHDCGWSALSAAGVTTTLLGVGAIVPGIVFWSIGASDVARARAWRRMLSGPR
jgi:hypothetical protein